METAKFNFEASPDWLNVVGFSVDKTGNLRTTPNIVGLISSNVCRLLNEMVYSKLETAVEYSLLRLLSPSSMFIVHSNYQSCYNNFVETAYIHLKASKYLKIFNLKIFAASSCKLRVLLTEKVSIVCHDCGGISWYSTSSVEVCNSHSQGAKQFILFPGKYSW